MFPSHLLSTGIEFLTSLLRIYVEQHTKRQVYKNAKTRNVYHRCLCLIFDQTKMAEEQESLWYHIQVQKE